MRAKSLLLAAALAVALAGCSTKSPDIVAATSTGGANFRTPSGGDASVIGNDVGNADRVLFETDSAVIQPQYQGDLAALAARMREHPSAHFVIEGHADERGTREYNIALGDRRAIALRNALIDRGVTQGQIAQVVSYGKERPEVAGSSETAWAQNRRAVLVQQ